mmetsp:Transcript_3698/g.6302  ORF Transcript_3698/g.6302 Transcript_3698/m.6302 type:complete len:116 (+) Transcript_3698:1211-1558(+)
MVRQIAHAKVPSSLEPLLTSSIIVAGGNSMIPGFVERLRYELEECGRLNTLAEKEVRIYNADWNAPKVTGELGVNRCSMASVQGLQQFNTRRREDLVEYAVSRQMYEEEGPRVLK